MNDAEVLYGSIFKTIPTHVEDWANGASFAGDEDWLNHNRILVVPDYRIRANGETYFAEWVAEAIVEGHATTMCGSSKDEAVRRLLKAFDVAES